VSSAVVFSGDVPGMTGKLPLPKVHQGMPCGGMARFINFLQNGLIECIGKGCQDWKNAEIAFTA